MFKVKAKEIPKIQAFLFAYTGNKRRLQKTLNESHFVDKEKGLYHAYYSFKIINWI